MATRVIGIGQPAAGDDGVGHAVIDALEATSLPAETELCRVREASALLPLIDGDARVVIVDAILDEASRGAVRVLDAGDLDRVAMSGVSSHGIGVAQAVELAHTLSPQTAPVHFVAVSIGPPTTYGEGLSQDVASAVPEAVRAVVQLLQGEDLPDA